MKILDWYYTYKAVERLKDIKLKQTIDTEKQLMKVEFQAKVLNAVISILLLLLLFYLLLK